MWRSEFFENYNENSQFREPVGKVKTVEESAEELNETNGIVEELNNR